MHLEFQIRLIPMEIRKKRETVRTEYAFFMVHDCPREKKWQIVVQTLDLQTWGLRTCNVHLLRRITRKLSSAKSLEHMRV